MLVKTFGSAVTGISAQTITVEVIVGGEIQQNAPIHQLVGLPDNAVREGFMRIESALKVSGYRIPRKRIIANMAPADIRKEGSAYDLTIAIGMLAANELIPATELGDYIIMGELSLDGSLQPLKGVLPIAIQARQEGFKGLIVPHQNAREGAIVNNVAVFGAKNITEVIDHLSRKTLMQEVIVDTREEFANAHNIYQEDFSDVKGQENIKRAMEIGGASCRERVYCVV